MESNYRNKDFEQYVKGHADQHRMFPSDKIWKNIHNTLHTRRKWYGIGLASLLLLTGTAVTMVMITYPVSKKQPFTAVKNSPETITTPAVATIPKTVLPFNGQVAVQPKPLFSEGRDNTTNAVAFLPAETTELFIAEHTELRTNANEQLLINTEARTNTIINSAEEKEYLLVTDEQFGQPSSSIAIEKEITAAPAAAYPLTIESVTNEYMPKKAGKKLSWQFFITPTISYRKLNANESLANSTTNYPFSTLSDINNAVTHKPDLGLQIGTSFHYPLTKSLRIRGGLQFNINRYDIKAFSYNPEVATIRLNEPYGVSSVWAWTSYRNYSGYKSNWLKNYYFSVSAPIGLEMKLLGNDKTSFGIASTIQPTYVIKDKAFLISADYKNYAKVPSLVRDVNLNAGFEAFINYSNGKTRWQVGPQARYQLLSSFQNKYPVKEHLFDFGVKVGVFLNER